MREDEGNGYRVLSRGDFLVISIAICVSPYLMIGLFISLTQYSYFGLLPFVLAVLLTYRTWRLCP